MFKVKKAPKSNPTPPPMTDKEGSATPAKKPKKGIRYFFWRWLVTPVLILIISVHLLIAGLLMIWQDGQISYSMFMFSHHLSGGSVAQTWVDYDDIAKSAKQAVIASEDAKFATHGGFDMEGIEKAIKANEATGAISRGGSTISQQLAKNLFLTSHRSYIRKGEEAIITLMMEHFWTKERILEVYLNVVEFGEGIYGIEQASYHYYQKPAKELSREQSALLISMLPNPKYYQKNMKNKRLHAKKRIVLRRMPTAVLPQK